MNKEIGLYFIIDGGFTNEFCKMAQLAIKYNVRIIQYRHKEASFSEMLRQAQKIREITKGTKTLFVVNDNLQVALQAGADGLHIGQQDESYVTIRKYLPNKIIGISTHNPEQAVEAEKLGADYIGFGPIFPTTTKKKIHPCSGIDGLSEIFKNIKIPKVAIGGIKLSNLNEIYAAGADGVAMISEILNSKNPEKKIEEAMKIANKYADEHQDTKTPKKVNG